MVILFLDLGSHYIQGRCVPRDGEAVLTQIVGVRGVMSAVLAQII